MTKRPPFPLLRIIACGLALLAAPVLTAPASAQNPFSAAVAVNGAIVTHFELDQRALFLETVRAPGDLEAEALETLVNERLQVQEARRLGLVATSAQIERGVAEFASRAELTANEFLSALAEEGVAPETVRDFVANGISWRNVVQRRFTDLVEISDSDVDTAMRLRTNPENVRILLAEIVVPVTPENSDTLRDEIGRLAAELNGRTDDFSEAARRFSAAQTREDGGLTGWRPIAAIPPALLEQFITLAPGETSGPVILGPALAIFQMRGLQETGLPAPNITTIDYVTIAIPGGRSPEGQAAASALRAEIDVCDDLYGQRPGAFERFDVPLRDIPDDIGLALSGLDEGEMSFDVLRQPGDIVLAVMLCARNVGEPEGSRDAMRQRLFEQQLAGYADGLLEQLRADAIIDYTP
jgi:peptidyl-prolyl cis-trans isomerase SurA